MNIIFEISGICNAKCLWCQTGAKNREKVKESTVGKNSFIDFAAFKESIIYMKKMRFIKSNSRVILYNWGEPFLHPKFKEIIRFLKDQNINTCLSTNASKVVLFDNKDDLSKVSSLIISMCGFSQSSYDRIHGFEFNKITENIETMVKNFKECGYRGDTIISYHTYQFNLHEIGDAFKFANKNKIMCNPCLAFINDFEKGMNYLTGDLDSETLKLMGQDLFLYAIEKKRREAKRNYRCPQFDMITIDHNCNVITCCGDSTVYKNIIEVSSLNQINEWRNKSKVCEKCKDLKMDYIGGNPMMYEDLIPNKKMFNLLYNKLYNRLYGKLIRVIKAL